MTNTTHNLLSIASIRALATIFLSLMLFGYSLCQGQMQPQLPVYTPPPSPVGSGNGSKTLSRGEGGETDLGNGSEEKSPNASAQEPKDSARSSSAAVNGDYILSVGDTIELAVYHEPDLGIRSKIGNDGMVQLPLLGEVRLAGLSARNASELIRKKYDADYVVNPQIYLDVISYHPRKFSVEGQVGRPGSYAFPGGDAPGLLDAIGIAGGFLPSADRGRITVKRRSGNELRTIPLSAKDLSDAGVQYFQLQPGDDINVGEAKFTIIGQVNRPGTYDVGGSDSLGLLEAVGMAGGFTRIADRGHVVVKRREGDIMRTIKVNVKRLSTDRPDQFDIKTGDVINVGESWY